ncbi:MAG: hypothetical protein LBC61_04550 [Candidatus Peribacteria bacterium]|jgi:hypothetical protein|nr:hypothetical protein [Candidatus Peribacteria bacterium]
MFFSTKLANCKVMVDFQIQGSPESSTTEPGTIHHHKTLFSSLDFVSIFSDFSSKFIWFKFDISLASHLRFCVLLLINFSSLNSSKVFHSLQKGHCHCHFILSFQQDLQINIRK